ncbi:MAG: NCS2 family permease [bacterium]|jgi:AGZA family xanthine/uracil permease-like MFS transporter
MIPSIERYFRFKELGTDLRTELLAGVTTFLTMAYIVFVNPSILQDAGVPAAGAMAATCISAALGSLMMGLFAKYPIALAPGMGLNAYFTYTVVQGMGVPWQVALGAVFLSGVAFVALTAFGIRQLILSALPQELYASIAAGIGLFIAFVGLRNAGIIVTNPSTSVALGDLTRPSTLLALFGLLLIGVLMARRVRAAMLIGILATAVVGAAVGLVRWQPQPFSWTAATSAALQLDIRGALEIGLIEIVFVFLFVDLFDNIGTLIGVAKKARLIDDSGEIPRVGRIMLTDATATITGSLTGTSTVVSYIESAAGVVAGGRSGLTAVVVGVLFVFALFLAPVVGFIPSAATAPALIIVGSLMATTIAEVRWDDYTVALPAFLTMVTIPLSFSIANGIAFGFIAYTALKVFAGEYRRVSWLVYVLTALFVLRFAYLGAG